MNNVQLCNPLYLFNLYLNLYLIDDFIFLFAGKCNVLFAVADEKQVLCLVCSILLCCGVASVTCGPHALC